MKTLDTYTDEAYCLLHRLDYPDHVRTLLWLAALRLLKDFMEQLSLVIRSRM